MSLSASLFGRDSLIHKATNIMGLGIPGWLDRQFGAKDAEPQMRSLGELSQQTAKEAEPRVIVWGRVRPIGGNIIHCQAPVIRWVTTEVDGGGGKGGKKKKQTQTVQHVHRTYAIGVCEGPITAFSRIWRNNKLVYDGRGTAWGAANNGVFLRAFRLYLGGWAQMPSPNLEAIWGAGNVPAYRGTAYMVAIDEDLTDQGGMVPQWLFEVERAEGTYLTSRPYRAEQSEALVPDPAVPSFDIRGRQSGFGDEAISAAPAITDATLQGPYEAFEAAVATPIVTGATISGPQYSSEALAAEPAVTGQKFSIPYNSPDPDAIAPTPGVTGATVT